jgi:purine-nucleoside phosphorylase
LNPVPLPDPRLVESARDAIASQQPSPKVGVVLGSGLGGFAQRIDDARVIGYSDIPHMPEPGVSGHGRQLFLGTVGGVRVACLQGRVHAYEGYDDDRVCFGVSLLAALGCQAVLLSNASGGISPGLEPGALMLISDHLNLTGRNPLSGPEDPRAPRFPDMSAAYDPALRKEAKAAATELGLELREGVYAAMLGPSYETPAEIQMLARLGASSVGMSTALEVLALRGLGVRTAAISCITNLAAGLGTSALSHDEVQRVADAARARFEALFQRWIERVGVD